MNLSSFRTEFKAKVARRDMSDAQADEFIRDGIARLNEELRCLEMQGTVNAVADVGGGYSRITKPTDFLEAIRVFSATSKDELTSVPYSTLLRYSTETSTPSVYAYRNGVFYVRPYSSSLLTLDYYQKVGALAADADTNVIIDSNPHVLRLAAQVFAAEHYRMTDKVALWNDHFTSVRDSLNALAQDAVYGGGTMQVQPINGGYYG